MDSGNNKTYTYTRTYTTKDGTVKTYTQKVKRQKKINTNKRGLKKTTKRKIMDEVNNMDEKQKINLLNTIKNVQPRKEYKCGDCRKTFRSKNAKKRHRKREHIFLPITAGAGTMQMNGGLFVGRKIKYKKDKRKMDIRSQKEEMSLMDIIRGAGGL